MSNQSSSSVQGAAKQAASPYGLGGPLTGEMYPRGAGAHQDAGEAEAPATFQFEGPSGAQGRDGAADPEAEVQFNLGRRGAEGPEGRKQAAIREGREPDGGDNFMTPGDTPVTGAVCSATSAPLCLAAKAPSRDLPPSHDPSPFTAGDHPPPQSGDGRARSQPPTREEFFPGNSPHPGHGQQASFHPKEKENFFDQSGRGPQGGVGPMRLPPRRAVSQPRSPLGILWETRRDPPGSGHPLHPSGEAPLEALPPCDPEQLLPSSEGENSVQNLFLFPGRCSGNGSDSLRGEPDPLTTPLSREVALVPSPVGRAAEGCFPGQEASDSPRGDLGERLWGKAQSEPLCNSANSAISANFGFQEDLSQRNSANSANFPQGGLDSLRPQALSGNFPHGNMGGISTEMVANLSGEPQSRGLRRSFLPMVISEEFLSSSRGGVCQIQEAPSAALNLRESHGPSPHGSRGGREESRNLLGHRRKRSETSDASSEDFPADATPPGGIPEITWTEQFNGPAPSELRSFFQRQGRDAMHLDLDFPGGRRVPFPTTLVDRRPSL